MSGRRVTFVGDAMSAVVQAIDEIHALIGVPPCWSLSPNCYSPPWTKS